MTVSAMVPALAQVCGLLVMYPRWATAIAPTINHTVRSSPAYRIVLSSVVVPTATDGVAHAARHHEDQANDEDYDPYGP